GQGPAAHLFLNCHARFPDQVIRCSKADHDHSHAPEREIREGHIGVRVKEDDLPCDGDDCQEHDYFDVDLLLLDVGLDRVQQFYPYQDQEEEPEHVQDLVVVQSERIVQENASDHEDDKFHDRDEDDESKEHHKDGIHQLLELVQPFQHGISLILLYGNQDRKSTSLNSSHV